MTLLFKLITKIKNQVIMSILLIFFGVIMLFCSAGFFILPFIIYGETSRVAFLIAWGICSIEVFIEMLLASKRKMEIDKKENEKYQKDKVVYWFSVVSSILAIIFVFLLVFLKRNFKLSVNIFDICFFFISFLIITACASNLLSMYKNKYKQMARDGVITFLCLFSIICVAAGIKAYEENNLASKILIAFGTIVLLVVCIKLVFNFLLSIEKMNTVSSSIIFFIGIGVLGAILLRYVVTDCKLQEILTTIFAAVVGGTITLGGVAWTIKDGNKKRQSELERVENERKEEERKKYRPFVNVYVGYNLQGLPSTEPIMAVDWLKNTDEISNERTESLVVENNIRNCCFSNTDFASFYVYGIKINENMTCFDSIRFIRKEHYFPLNFTGPIYTEKPIETISLILEDMLGNLYELKLDFSVNSAYQQIVINGNEPTIFIGKKEILKG